MGFYGRVGAGASVSGTSRWRRFDRCTISMTAKLEMRFSHEADVEFATRLCQWVCEVLCGYRILNSAPAARSPTQATVRWPGRVTRVFDHVLESCWNRAHKGFAPVNGHRRLRPRR
jgi:hypothetical protein